VTISGFSDTIRVQAKDRYCMKLQLIDFYLSRYTSSQTNCIIYQVKKREAALARGPVKYETVRTLRPVKALDPRLPEERQPDAAAGEAIPAIDADPVAIAATDHDAITAGIQKLVGRDTEVQVRVLPVPLIAQEVLCHLHGRRGDVVLLGNHALHVSPARAGRTWHGIDEAEVPPRAERGVCELLVRIQAPGSVQVEPWLATGRMDLLPVHDGQRFPTDSRNAQEGKVGLADLLALDKRTGGVKYILTPWENRDRLALPR